MSELRGFQILLNTMLLGMLLLMFTWMNALYYAIYLGGVDISIWMWFMIMIMIISGLAFIVSIANKQRKMCSKCGKAYSSRFCPNCGISSDENISIPKKQTCLVCGKTLKGEKFCPYCGAESI